MDANDFRVFRVFDVVAQLLECSIIAVGGYDTRGTQSSTEKREQTKARAKLENNTIFHKRLIFE